MSTFEERKRKFVRQVVLTELRSNVITPEVVEVPKGRSTAFIEIEILEDDPNQDAE